MALHAIRGGKAGADEYRVLNVPRARIVRSSTQAITTATITTIGFDNPQPAATWDTDSMWQPAVSTTRLTVKTPGVYDVKGAIAWAGAAAGSTRVAWIHKNGSAAERFGSDSRPSAVAQVFHTLTPPAMALNADDYLELIVFQDSGGNVNISPVAPSMAADLSLTLISTLG